MGLKKDLAHLFPKEKFYIDENSRAIIFGANLARKIFKKTAVKIKHIAIVEQYPTIDALEVYREMLS